MTFFDDDDGDKTGTALRAELRNIEFPTRTANPNPKNDIAHFAEDSFVLTKDHIKNIILNGGMADFYNGLSRDRPKLRDRHVRALLSNSDHVNKQNVRTIVLDDCKAIGDYSLIFIADHFPQLEQLYVYGCDLITDNGIIAVTKKCNKLVYLNCSLCSKISNEALEAIASNLPQLKRLLIRGCDLITDKGIISVTKNCRKLTELDYADCSKVTDAALNAIVVNLPLIAENLPADDKEQGEKFRKRKESESFNQNVKSANYAFVPSREHQLFPVSNQMNNSVPIFDEKKIVEKEYIQKKKIYEPQISTFAGDSFHNVLIHLENNFSSDDGTSTMQYIRPRDTIGIGAIISPAVRNEFEFDASYKGVTKFAITILKVASSELNFPSPYVDRASLRKLVLPNILERIDGIQSYCQAQDIVKEIGCAYLHSATFGLMEKFSTCSKQKPSMSSKEMASELRYEAKYRGPGLLDKAKDNEKMADNTTTTIIDFELAPISNLAKSRSKEESWLEVAVIEYCINIFDPYKMFTAFAPIRNNLAVAKDIRYRCGSILKDSMKGGLLDRSFLKIANRKVLALVKDIVAMVQTDNTSMNLRESKKSRSNDDSMFFEDLTEPELKAYLLSLVNGLRQDNALTNHSSISFIEYLRSFRRRKRRSFRESTARYLKEMSDLCRDEESIVRATFHSQEIWFKALLQLTLQRAVKDG